MNKYPVYRDRGIVEPLFWILLIIFIFLFIFLPIFSIKIINKKILETLRWYKKSKKRIAAI